MEGEHIRPRLPLSKYVNGKAVPGIANNPGPVGINVQGGGAMMEGTSQAEGVVPLKGLIGTLGC